MATEFILELLLGVALLAVGLFSCLVFYARWNYGSLESLGIPVVRPHWLLGSMHDHGQVVHHLQDVERLTTMGQVYGVYEGRQPRVYVSDPELVRQICTTPECFDKNASDFGFPLINEVVELCPSNEKWRAIRAHLTPLLTTGKLKQINETMAQLSDEHCQALDDFLGAQGRGKIDFRQWLPPLAIEMIGKTLCGIKFENTRDPNNEFIKGMKTALLGDEFAFDWTYNWTLVFPFLKKLYPGLPHDGVKLFEDTMRSVLDSRELSGVKQPDMVGKLLEMRQKINTPEFARMGITELTVHAQAFELFVASYGGIVYTIDAFMYYMAMNPELQDKLAQEVDTVLAKHVQNFDSGTLGELRYLHACLSEAFRIVPFFFRPERVCIKDWQYEGWRIKKGMQIVFPLFALHHNPDLYPNPGVFDPERFLSGDASTSSFSFLTFGHGPRACIGQRFIYDMMKIFLAKFFRGFRVERREDTKWKLQPGNHFFIQYDPIYVNLAKMN